MTNLTNQPFLLSLEQAVNQTGNFDDYQTMLQEHQILFRGYVQECCHPDIPAPKRFEFLKTVD
jgi:hypothetical protein